MMAVTRQCCTLSGASKLRIGECLRCEEFVTMMTTNRCETTVVSTDLSSSYSDTTQKIFPLNHSTLSSDPERAAFHSGL
ncbi:unnamed protein product [Dicrocoelium dendriticum]|nr:unnamed protein product [Dicrocoelium dendriticum]